MLSQLEPREADIIRLRFGLEGRDPLTLEEVGAKIGDKIDDKVSLAAKSPHAISPFCRQLCCRFKATGSV